MSPTQEFSPHADATIVWPGQAVMLQLDVFFEAYAVFETVYGLHFIDLGGYWKFMLGTEVGNLDGSFESVRIPGEIVGDEITNAL